jgi:hypothetical protein
MRSSRPACLQARSQRWERQNSFEPRLPRPLRKTGCLARSEPFGVTLQVVGSQAVLSHSSDRGSMQTEHTGSDVKPNFTSGLRGPENREGKGLQARRRLRLTGIEQSRKVCSAQAKGPSSNRWMQQ